MEAALTARMRRTSYEMFSSHFVFFVVKKTLSPGFTHVFPLELHKTGAFLRSLPELLQSIYIMLRSRGSLLSPDSILLL